MVTHDDGCSKRRRIGSGLGVLVAGLLAASDAAQAQDPAAANGPAVLTVAGAITKTNRGPFDDVADSLAKHHDRRFDNAVEFDLAMLEALGMHQVTIGYGKWPHPARFEGPRLTDVLAAAGADGKTLTVVALDGYTAEIGAAELAAAEWVAAVKRDGRYLAIGGRGPVWLVYPPRDGAPASDEDEQRWPWAVFLIEVR